MVSCVLQLCKDEISTNYRSMRTTVIMAMIGDEGDRWVGKLILNWMQLYWINHLRTSDGVYFFSSVLIHRYPHHVQYGFVAVQYVTSFAGGQPANSPVVKCLLMESQKSLLAVNYRARQSDQLNNTKEETKRANISQISSRYEICEKAYVTRNLKSG